MGCWKCFQGTSSLIYFDANNRPDLGRSFLVCCDCTDIRDTMMFRLGSALTMREAIEKTSINPKRWRLLNNETADSFGYIKGE